MLLGNNEEEYFAFTSGIEAGNKNLVITGTVNMYGSTRDYRARLLSTAYAGQNTLQVQAGLDWMAGEMLSVAPTNMRTMDTDTCVIESYDTRTGLVVCSDRLEGFHFGDSDSTEPEYGVDMRAEIALLTRNIEITAS